MHNYARRFFPDQGTGRQMANECECAMRVAETGEGTGKPGGAGA